MQDLSTGELHPLEIEAFKALVPKMEFDPFSRLDELQTNIQEAKDKAVPNREHQGPVFQIGEVLEIKGGKFRVNGFSQKRLYLDSIPSL